jgi:VWFA-related protein
MKTINIFLFFLLLGQYRWVVFAQTQAPKDKNNLHITIPTEIVTIDTQVVNKQTGQLVPHLARENFTLLEDGVKQNISHFSTRNRDLSVILLIDGSGSAVYYHKQIYKAGLQILGGLSPTDNVALMVFGTDAGLVQGFTNNKNLLGEKMSDMALLFNTAANASENNNPRGGGTHIGDGLYTTAKYLRDHALANSRRVIIMITDNIPLERNVVHSRSEVAQILLESDIVVHGVVLSTPNDHKSGKAFSIVNGALDRIFFGKSGGDISFHAKQTGGTVLAAEADDLTDKITGLINFLRSYYSLGYAPSNTRWDGKFRRIKVTVNLEIEKKDGGVVVLTRQGYYAHPRKASKAVQEKPLR